MGAKTMFAFLPSEKDGYVCLAQNRFSKIRGDRQLEYPLIPAWGLTQLKKAGFDAYYIDAIWESLSPENFYKKVSEIQPDILYFETKTPQIKQSWKICNELKKRFPNMKIAAMGDHVSALPAETLQNSGIDFSITGGDFDVTMAKLAQHLFEGKEMPKGVHWKEKGEIKNSGSYELTPNLDDLPFIDRELVPWQNYHENWMLHDKVMYMYASRGCPYRCTFCSWPQNFYGYKTRMRSVPNILAEMEILIKKYNVKEFFFDDDTFNWNKKWLMEFCNSLIEKNWGIIWNTNGRVDHVDEESCKAMAKSGCRIVKFGVESASPKTLKIINKAYTVEEVRKGFEVSKNSGILRHATVMLGYPWETKEDLQATINLVKELDVDTCQFSMPCVYPGTQLWRDAIANNWLKFKEGEWEKFDMSVPTMKNQHMPEEEVVKMVESAWLQVYFAPKFLARKILNTRSLLELRWLFRGTKGVIKGNLLPLLKLEKSNPAA